MADDFYSFDEALDELKLKEEELKRLVSEGELRAFRKGDTMKIRRADVELLRSELDSDVADLDETVDELVSLIVAQRNYEVNSRAIKASDEMLQQTNQLIR